MSHWTFSSAHLFFQFPFNSSSTICLFFSLDFCLISPYIHFRFYIKQSSNILGSCSPLWGHSPRLQISISLILSLSLYSYRLLNSSCNSCALHVDKILSTRLIHHYTQFTILFLDYPSTTLNWSIQNTMYSYLFVSCKTAREGLWYLSIRRSHLCKAFTITLTLFILILFQWTSLECISAGFLASTTNVHPVHSCHYHSLLHACSPFTIVYYSWSDSHPVSTLALYLPTFGSWFLTIYRRSKHRTFAQVDRPSNPFRSPRTGQSSSICLLPDGSLSSFWSSIAMISSSYSSSDIYRHLCSKHWLQALHTFWATQIY